MSTQIKYKGNTLATIENESKTLSTANTWIEDNIELVSIGGNPDGYVYQDENGYLVLADGVDEDIVLKPRRVTYNDTYTPDEGEAYNKVVVDTNFTRDFFEKSLVTITPTNLTGLTSTGNHTFRYQNNLINVDLPDNIINIGNYSFANCSDLKTINFNNITSIGNHAFSYCTGLTEINIPSTLTNIEDYAFEYCGLKRLIIPKTVEILGENLFQNCTSLSSVIIYGNKTWSHTTDGARSIFNTCTALQSFYAPHITFRGNGLEFKGCTSLTDVYAPNLTITQFTFQGCTSLTNLVSNTAGCYTKAFSGCSNLESIDFRQRTQFFRTTIFENCTSLETIVLRGTTLTTLTYTDVFNNTPFAEGGTGGTIYIPKVLYDELGTGSSLDYKAASNWSTFDSYGTITWAQIEGSQYENYYVDGRGVLQTVTENLTNCSISNDLAHYHTEYVTEIIPDDGYTINSVTVTMAGNNITSTAYNSSTHTITIASPEGEIVITAVGGAS